MSGPDDLSQTPRLSQSRWLWAVGFLLVSAAAIRGVGLGRPLVGNFATRNVVCAMIARNWAEGRGSVWYPALDCLAGGGRAFHLVDFPASAYLAGWLWANLGGSLDVWGRATSLTFTVAAVGLLVWLMRRRHGDVAALGAGFLLAFSPVAVIYGQSFMLEASVMCFTVAAMACLARWLANGRWVWLAAAGAALGLAVWTKLYMLVLLVPWAAEVLWATGVHEGGQRRDRRVWAALVVGAAAVLPAVVWYGHIYHVSDPAGPLGGRIFYSVRRSAAVHRPPHPLLWSADYYRQVLDDLAGVVLTPVGFCLAALGLAHPRWRSYLPWLAACALLVAALPLKFYRMNYYWMVVLPPLCILAGLGCEVLLVRLRPRRWAIAGGIALVLLFSVRHAAGPAWRTPEEDRGVVTGGQLVQRFTGPDEPVVTMHGTTIDLLYYCNRPGWAVAPDTAHLSRALDAFQRRGARCLVVAGPAAARPPPAVARLSVIRQGPGYRICLLPDRR